MRNDDNKTDNTLPPKDQALLLDHDYDGIKELDYPLPNWWLWIFGLTIVFSIVYVGHYMLGSGLSLAQELDLALASIKTKQAAQANAAVDLDLETLLNDAGLMQVGAASYAGKCAACHGDKGQGLIGPNLTDKFWLYGDGKANAIAKVIAEGVAEKGMPPWGNVLPPEELRAVSVYVRNLKGTAPTGGKEPQGEPRE